MAEAAYSDWAVTLTLTYRDQEDLSHLYLNPPHFQKFIRALRRRGHSIRYLVTGEYGERKGRAHFHCILFGKGPRPDWPQQRNFHMEPEVWPYGHVFADWNFNERAVKYVCKYLLKENSTDSWFSLSKKPALGARFFEKKAKEAVDMGVSRVNLRRALAYSLLDVVPSSP